MSKTIDIIEVGPRDGFQNQKEYIPADIKIKIIESIIDAGVKHMQITSFVSPKAIPQMRDATDVTKSILHKYKDRDLDLFALVPNLFGAKAASEAGLKKVTNVISLSKSHNMANIRRTHEQSFDELAKIRSELPDLEVCVDVATAFGCPFEGKYHDVEPLIKFMKRAYDLGIRTFTLCDTVGLADPQQIRDFLRVVRGMYQDIRLEIHIHDTRGMGLVNTLAAVESGVDGIQGALGGLGGCPFAPGASGNTATEDIVYMLTQMGYDTGIDADALIEAAKKERELFNGNYSGHLINIEKPNACTGKN